MKNKETTRDNYIKLYKYLMNKGFEFEEVKSTLNPEPFLAFLVVIITTPLEARLP